MFCNIFFRKKEKKENNLKMKGWSSGKKPTVQKENNKISDLEGIFETSSFDCNNLTALQTVYVDCLHVYFLRENTVFSQENSPICSYVTDGSGAANIV